MLLKAVTACCRLCRYFCLPLNLLAAAALPLHAAAPARLQETLSCRKRLHRSQDSQVSGFPSLRLFLSWGSSNIWSSEQQEPGESCGCCCCGCWGFHTAIPGEGIVPDWACPVVLLSAKHETKKAPKSLFSVSCISTKLPKPPFCSCFLLAAPLAATRTEEHLG